MVCYIKHILFLAIFILLPMGGGGAQNVAENKDKPQTKQASFPDPTSLSADWWKYFEVTGDVFKQRIKFTRERLDKLIEALAPEQRDAAVEGKKLLLGKLQELPKLRSVNGKAEQPLPPVFKKAYTIEEWLLIGRKLRSQRNDVEKEKEDIGIRQEKETRENDQYQTKLAHYLNLEITDPSRPLEGLELMNNRVFMEVSRLALKKHQTTLKLREEKAKVLAEQQQVAVKRLTATFDYVINLESTIRKARKTLDDRTKALKKLKAKPSVSKPVSRKRKTQPGSGDSENPEDRVLAHFASQKSIIMHVEEAGADIELSELVAQKALAQLILGRSGINIEVMRAHLVERSKRSRQVTEKQLGWVKNSVWQFKQALLFLSQTQDDDKNKSKLAKLQRKRLDQAQRTLITLQKLKGSISELGLIDEQLDIRLALAEGRVQHWQTLFWQKLSTLWQSTYALFTGSLFTVGDTPVTAVGLAWAMLILSIASLLSRMLRRAMAHIGERQEGVSVSALYTIGRLAHYVILIVGAILALSSIGLDFGNLALIAGALSVGIGFGLQTVVNNFVSGLILLFEQPLKVGDFIELQSGLLGEVKEINVRSTRINTRDNYDIIVPNSELINNRVTNLTLKDAMIRIRVPFGVAYGTDKNLVKRVAIEAAERVAFTITKTGKEPQVRLTSFGDNSLNFELVIWISPAVVKRHGWIKSAYLWEIETLFSKNNISFPFPQRDIHIKSGNFDMLVEATEE